jgi:hypothetical protein
MNPWIRRAAVSFVIPYAVRKFQERRGAKAPVQPPASRRSQLISGAAGRMPARRGR